MGHICQNLNGMKTYVHQHSGIDSTLWIWNTLCPMTLCLYCLDLFLLYFAFYLQTGVKRHGFLKVKNTFDSGGWNGVEKI